VDSVRLILPFGTRRLTAASTNDPTTAPATPQDVAIHFEKGLPIKVSSSGKEWTDSLELFIALNELGKLHGIGRIDIVEDRFIGIKSRGGFLVTR
jgi:argininosuccinate synthase